MKKLFFALALVPFFAQALPNSGDENIKHLKEAIEYKNEWFKYKKDYISSEIDLCAKHFTEKMNAKIAIVEKYNTANATAQEVFAATTAKMTELCMKQMKECYDFHTAWYNKGKSLYEKQVAAMNKKAASSTGKVQAQAPVVEIDEEEIEEVE